MRKKVKLSNYVKMPFFLLYISLMTYICVATDCQNIKSQFNSYNEVEQIVKVHKNIAYNLNIIV